MSNEEEKDQDKKEKIIIRPKSEPKKRGDSIVIPKPQIKVNPAKDKQS